MLATRLGLPVQAAFDVLDVTPLASQAQCQQTAIESATSPRFAIRLARKDADLIVEAAAAGVEIAVGSAVRSLLDGADEAGWSERGSFRGPRRKRQR